MAFDQLGHQCNRRFAGTSGRRTSPECATSCRKTSSPKSVSMVTRIRSSAFARSSNAPPPGSGPSSRASSTSTPPRVANPRAAALRQQAQDELHRDSHVADDGLAAEDIRASGDASEQIRLFIHDSLLLPIQHRDGSFNDSRGSPQTLSGILAAWNPASSARPKASMRAPLDRHGTSSPSFVKHEAILGRRCRGRTSAPVSARPCSPGRRPTSRDRPLTRLAGSLQSCADRMGREVDVAGPSIAVFYSFLRSVRRRGAVTHA